MPCRRSAGTLPPSLPPSRRSRLRRLVAAALGGLLLPALGVAPSSAAAPDRLPPTTAFTPLTAALITTPAPFRGSDGLTHLSYELLLTNALSARVRLDQVDVADPRSGRVLWSLTGRALVAASNPVGMPRPSDADGGDASPRQPDAAPVLASSATWVVWLDLVLKPGTPLPQALVHRLRTAVLAPDGGATPVRESVGRTAVVQHPPVALAPPVQPGTWYASESCCGNTHHRRGLAPINGALYVPQRFAVDWFRLGSRNQAWQGDPRKLTSYLGFRQPVLAAAAGRVVDVQDGLRDNTPPVPPAIPPIQDTVGNHITLEVAPGVYLLYAHLEAGSLEVRRGDRVTPGRMLARIGNSGNSTTPHLHFQVMTTREFFPTDSPPYVFRAFTLLGQVGPRIWDDNLGLQPTGVLPVVPAAPPTRHALELPLDRNVIAF
ncbi:M23 family metallopeptidase [Streptacidiphilus sp. PB12-B1b]|nr:M23 family metallopeptidase [Streptacidiphilus sp. PB12-B1b]